MKIGKKLQTLRRQAGLTQRELAEQLGVTDRAVSRWETDHALPDVTQLPALAGLLHTTIDALLGADPAAMRQQIEQAQTRCTALLNQGRAVEAVAELRALSADWPDQPEIMVYLARALLRTGSEAALPEALALCRAADGRPMRLSTAYGCKQVLTLTLSRMGRHAEAVRIVTEELPSLWVSRELMLPRAADPALARRARRSNVDLLTGLLTDTLTVLARESGNAAWIDAADSLRRIISDLPSDAADQGN